jgi:hypothetical protein
VGKSQCFSYGEVQVLANEYTAYNWVLAKKINDLANSKTKKETVKHLNVSTKFSIEVLEHNELKEIFSNGPRLMDYPDHFPPEMFSSSRLEEYNRNGYLSYPTPEDKSAARERLRLFKRDFGPEYQRSWQNGLFSQALSSRDVTGKEFSPIETLDILEGQGKKAFGAYGTIRVELERGRMYALAHTFSAYITDGSGKLDFSNSVVYFMHQDDLSTEKTLEKTSRVFAEACLWDQDDLDTLKDKVGLIRYLLGISAPDSRGSSAIAEWIEEAIYAYHGIRKQTDPDKLMDLEAMTHPLLPQFLEQYRSVVTCSR